MKEYKQLLSSEDVLKIAGKKAYLITYDKIKQLSDINELFRNGIKAVIILYRESENVGHWVALIKHNKNLIEYYDSYGFPIDRPLTWWKNDKIGLGQDHPYLSELLLKYLEQNPAHQVVFNEYKYQGLKDKNSATCGRYVGYRIRNSKMPLCKYQQYFNGFKKKIDPDLFIIKMTEKYLK